MSIRRRILEPLALLTAMCCIAVTWISGAALSTHRGVSESNAVALKAVASALDAETAYDELRALVDRVSGMTALLDPEQTAATFRDRSARLRRNLEALRGLSLGAEMENAVGELERETGAWTDAAAVVVGVEASRRLPSRHLIERGAKRIAESFEILMAAVRANSATQAVEARRTFLQQMTLALGALLAALALGVVLALQRSMRLISALRGLRASMRDIETGAFNKPVPGRERCDEIGAMARSVEAFGAGLRQLTAAKSRIEHLAMHDPLTGLPNRRYLYDKLDRTLGRGAHHGAPHARRRSVGVLHVDLDRFKTINDTRGHAAGDAVLRNATLAMRAHVREGDFVARAGGDEFVIVVDGVDDEARLMRLAERVIASISEPLRCEGLDRQSAECQVGASVGVAVGRAGEIDAERLLMNADIALYAAKKAGRGVCRFFSESLRETLERKDQLARELRQALADDEIEPFFQPQVMAKSGALCGFEALARWRRPTGEVLTPGKFLPVAEEMGLIEAIGEAMQRKSLAALRTWRAEGYAVPRVGVNLAEAELRRPDFADLVFERVEAAGLKPEDVGLEVLESALIDDDAEIVVRNVTLLERFGFPIELDDFGTEHASISNLKKFKVSRIKIDRSFITGVDHDAEQECIVTTLIELADRLGVEALAEGVETEAERAKLIDLGCDSLQGYAIATPMPFEECRLWLEARHGEPAWGVQAG